MANKHSKKFLIIILTIVTVVCTGFGPSFLEKAGVDRKTAEKIKDSVENLVSGSVRKESQKIVDKVKDFVDIVVTKLQEEDSSSRPANDNRLEVPAEIIGHQIVEHAGYTLSWNRKMLAADWVAYTLTADNLNNPVTSREGEIFKKDPMIQSCPEDSDYKGVGNLRPHPSARGHLKPASDARYSITDMEDTFYLSNCCIQFQFFNSGIWLTAENAVRDSARITGKVYVVTGPVMTDGPYEKFKDKLNIFKSFYKALLVTDGNNVQTIALLIPQDANRKNSLSTYAMSIDELEKITGIDFFPNLEDTVEEQTESTYDITYWPKSFR